MLDEHELSELPPPPQLLHSFWSRYQHNFEQNLMQAALYHEAWLDQIGEHENLQIVTQELIDQTPNFVCEEARNCPLTSHWNCTHSMTILPYNTISSNVVTDVNTLHDYNCICNSCNT